MQKLLFITCLFTGAFLNAQTQNSINMDGTNDYVTTTYAPPSGNTARTIEAYIKTTANSIPTSGGRQQIITDYGDFVNGGRFTFNVLWGGAIRLEVGGNGLSGTAVVNDGNWHHVAVVYDPVGSGTVSLYVDGNLDTSGSLTVAVNTGTSNNFTIGRRVDGVNNFTGSIDEVRFWNIALTQAQIAAGVSNEICPTTAGLRAYYQFDQGTAGGTNTGITTVTDLVNNNNGTLNGFSLNGTTSNWDIGAPLNTLINTDVSLTAGVLTASQNGASYQWINCATGNMINGATAATFAPTTVGNYGVQITVNGCTQRSDCTVVSTLTLDHQNLNDLQLVANPSNELLFSRAIEPSEQVSVYSITGADLSKHTNYALSASLLTSGIYVVTVKNELGAIKTFKWIRL